MNDEIIELYKELDKVDEKNWLNRKKDPATTSIMKTFKEADEENKKD